MHGVPVSPHHVVPLVSDMRMLSPTKGLKLKMVLAINKKINSFVIEKSFVEISKQNIL